MSRLQPKHKPGFPKGVSGNPKGRPKGVVDKRTAARETVMRYAGITPLEYMLRVLQAPPRKVSPRERMWAAKEAAPYVHRKMPIAIEGGDKPIPVINVNDLAKMKTEELEKLYGILTQLGLSGDEKKKD